MLKNGRIEDEEAQGGVTTISVREAESITNGYGQTNGRTSALIESSQN